MKANEKWDSLSPKERKTLIEKINASNPTEKPFGVSNSEKRFDKIQSTSLVLAIETALTSEPMATSVAEAEEVFGVIDEVPEKITDLDIVVSFDDTGSMNSVRKLVRQEVNTLVGQLFEEIPNLRVGVIIHNDYCDAPHHIYTQDLTSEKGKIVSFVNRDSPCGGGDAPECYELALHEAGKMSWKSKNRVVIMIGDEVPQRVGYSHPRFGTNYLDWKKETQSLSDMGVKVYGVQALGRRSSSFFYEDISRMTGGIKLDLTQFQHIVQYINAIVYHQSGGLERYRESNPSFSTNVSLRNMFDKLLGKTSSGSVSFDTLSKFQVMRVEKQTKIKDFVEATGVKYKRGRGFYQLVPRTADGKANYEIVQANKEVMFVDKLTGEVKSDTEWCRRQLGVPFGTEGTVRPLSIPDVMDKYDIFIQSNSFTRNLDPGGRFLYEGEYI